MVLNFGEKLGSKIIALLWRCKFYENQNHVH